MTQHEKAGAVFLSGDAMVRVSAICLVLACTAICLAPLPIATAQAEPTKAADDIEALKQKADAGDAESMFKLGARLHEGDGVRKDVKQALAWLEKASAADHVKAQLYLANVYDARGETKKANALWTRAAATGDAMAQSNLATMYYIGRGVKRDFATSLSWFMKAGAQGDAYALNKIGTFHEKGLGVKQDYKEAARWFERAAAKGSADAENNLGIFYRNGRGVERDYEKAHAWFAKAGEKGCYSAYCNRGNMYKNGQGSPPDFKKAAACWLKAAEGGVGMAQFNVGASYVTGRGLPRDKARGYKWIALACRYVKDAQRRTKALAAKRRLATMLTPAELSKANAMIKAFKPKPKVLSGIAPQHASR